MEIILFTTAFFHFGWNGQIFEYEYYIKQKKIFNYDKRS